MSSAREGELPDGWRLQVLERSMGVYEVRAVGALGHVVAIVGTDVDNCIAEARAGARNVEQQVRSSRTVDME